MMIQTRCAFDYRNRNTDAEYMIVNMQNDGGADYHDIVYRCSVLNMTMLGKT